MTLRGIIQNGNVKLSRSPRLPNGTVVDVLLTPVPAKRRPPTTSSNGHSRGSAKKVAPRRMTKKERLDAITAGFGRWKDRPEWEGMSTLEVLADLRQKSMGRLDG